MAQLLKSDAKTALGTGIILIEINFNVTDT
jgi:hypothetical protein